MCACDKSQQQHNQLDLIDSHCSTEKKRQPEQDAAGGDPRGAEVSTGTWTASSRHRTRCYV